MKKSICDFGNPREDLGYLIWQITKTWQRGKHRTVDEFGITASQVELLGVIFQLEQTKEGEVTQIDISQESDVDPMTTSTILRNLEKKELVIRKQSVADTRAIAVEVTEKGYELLLKAMMKMKERQKIILENIDKKTLIPQLQKLLDEINRLQKESKL